MSSFVLLVLLGFFRLRIFIGIIVLLHIMVVAPRLPLLCHVFTTTTISAFQVRDLLHISILVEPSNKNTLRVQTTIAIQLFLFRGAAIILIQQTLEQLAKLLSIWIVVSSVTTISATTFTTTAILSATGFLFPFSFFFFFFFYCPPLALFHCCMVMSC